MTTASEPIKPAVPVAPPTKRKRKAGASGAANDCFACQKKNQPCDRVRPYCGQCLKLGVDCSGYKTVLTWGVGVASRGKLRGQTLPVKKTDDDSIRRLSGFSSDGEKMFPQGRMPEAARQEPQKPELRSPTKRPRTTLYDASDVHQSNLNSYGSGQFQSATGDIEQYAAETRGPKPFLRGWTHQSVPFSQPRLLHTIHTAITPLQDESSLASSSATTQMSSVSQGGLADGQFDRDDGFADDSRLVNPFSPAQEFRSFRAPGQRPILNFSEPQNDPIGGVEHSPSIASGGCISSLYVPSSQFEPGEPVETPSGCGRTAASLVSCERNLSWEVDPQLLEDEAVNSRSGIITSIPSRSLAAPFSHLPKRMQQLLDFYDKAICPVLVTVDGPTNPYRMHILQSAVHSKALQNAIAALVTNNIRMRQIHDAPQIQFEIEDGTGGNATPEEQYFKAKSIEYLNVQLTSSNKQQASGDTVLATLLILCLFHVCNSGFSKFKTQLAGVQKLLRMRSNGLKSPFVGWVETFFAWFDVMTSAVNDRELEIGGDSLEIADLSTNLGALEQFSGCDGRLFKLIARLSRLNLLNQTRLSHGKDDTAASTNAQDGQLVRTVSRTGDFYSLAFDEESHRTVADGDTWQKQDAEASRKLFWHEWQDVQDRLRVWSVQTTSTGGGDPSPHFPSSVQERNMIDLSEAFRYSALIYVERLAHPELPSTKRNFQHLVELSLSHIETIGLGSCVTKFMLWPLFITGTECVQEQHRNLIRDRCIEIQQESGFYNNLSGLRVLERVWKENDSMADNAVIEVRNGQAFRWRSAMDRLDGEYIVL